MFRKLPLAGIFSASLGRCGLRGLLQPFARSSRGFIGRGEGKKLSLSEIIVVPLSRVSDTLRDAGTVRLGSVRWGVVPTRVIDLCVSACIYLAAQARESAT